MHAAESTNATWFLMADHSADRTWGNGEALASGSSSTSGAPAGVRPVYAASRSRKAPSAGRGPG